MITSISALPANIFTFTCDTSLPSSSSLSLSGYASPSKQPLLTSPPPSTKATTTTQQQDTPPTAPRRHHHHDCYNDAPLYIPQQQPTILSVKSFVDPHSSAFLSQAEDEEKKQPKKKSSIIHMTATPQKQSTSCIIRENNMHTQNNNNIHLYSDDDDDGQEEMNNHHHHIQAEGGDDDDDDDDDDGLNKTSVSVCIQGHHQHHQQQNQLQLQLQLQSSSSSSVVGGSCGAISFSAVCDEDDCDSRTLYATTTEGGGEEDGNNNNTATKMTPPAPQPTSFVVEAGGEIGRGEGGVIDEDDLPLLPLLGVVLNESTATTIHRVFDRRISCVSDGPFAGGSHHHDNNYDEYDDDDDMTEEDEEEDYEEDEEEYEEPEADVEASSVGREEQSSTSVVRQPSLASSSPRSDTPHSPRLLPPAHQWSSRSQQQQQQATTETEDINEAPPLLTVVLDLDETLVWNRGGGPSAVLRPYVYEALDALRSMEGVELVLWTASTETTAAPVVRQLGQSSGRFYFDTVIFRSPLWFSDNVHTKDLRLLGRPLEKVMIFDNAPQCLKINRRNGVLVEDFMGGGEVSPSSISSSGGGGVDCTMCNMVTTVQYVLDGVKKGSSVPESLYSCFELEQQLDMVRYEMPPGYSHDIISKLPPLDAPIHGDFFRITQKQFF